LDLGVSRFISPYSITTELASICRREVTPKARSRALQHLLDWFGCAYHGLRYPQGRSLVPHTREQPAGKSSALGQGGRHVDAAVFHNGCLGNIAEMDDVHRTSILHPGPVVIPAALALAEHLGAGGPALLDAIVRGYEAAIRLGSALGRRHYAFFHNTSTAGAFGAAGACASLMDLNEDQWVSAFGNAGTRTGGLWQMRNEACMSKALHNGMAAQSGLLAAQLAKRNFTGPRFILEGPQGLFPATASDGSPASICFDPNGEWRIHEVSFKPWAACRHAHPSIDAALKLKAQIKPGVEVQSVEIASYQDALKFCDRAEPQNESEAKFSLQHAVAIALTRGKPTLDDFMPPFTNAKVNALRAKTKVIADEALSKAYPEHYGARVQIELSDGQQLSEQVQDAWGDPPLPLNPAELEQKAFQLMSKVGVSKEQIDGIFTCIRTLPEARNLTALSKLLQSINAG
jgi:2-methylcitrate dehydratase PrpD